MSTVSIKYFHRDQQLVRIEYMPNAEFAARFPGVKGVRSDSFKMEVGYTASHEGPFPVQRKIAYKRFASRHECNSKCMNGHVNGTCECSCGGRNHGLGSILSAAA